MRSQSVPVRPDLLLMGETSRPNGLPDRRSVTAGLATVALGAGPALAQSTGFGALVSGIAGEGRSFDPSLIAEIARAVSKRPFAAPPNTIPEPLAGLSFDRYVAIKANPSGRIWEGEARGFVCEPLLRGFVFTTGVTLFTVEDGQVRRIVFDRSRFGFGDLALPPAMPEPGFSGVRITATGAGSPPFDFAIIQGASFFRAAARGQNYGILARALTLKPGEASGEEFPLFRALWLERPAAGTNALVIHGVVDSESVAGAVRMTFRPGDTTIVDVEMTLFPRVAIEHVGLGGMGGTFLFGPNVRQTTDEVRPAAYDASGLAILNGQGEWLWRPLNNPDTLQISAFIDDKPRGFGLLQRERSFSSFIDDVQHYERRPSLWIEPIGEWDQGAVQLIEIPSDAEINKNILAYWRPKAGLKAGAEVPLAFRQFWCWTPPERPELATVSATRSGRGSAARRRRFSVSFTGDGLGTSLPDLRAAITTAPGTIANVQVWPDPESKAVRVGFELDYGSETACEMRLVLQSGSKLLSETWLYRWTP